MNYSVTNRRGALICILGGLLWSVSWIVVGLAGGGRWRGEALWRTVVLNPAMLLLIAGLAAFHARQRQRSGWLGEAGFAISELGVGTMLLGNIVEFWISEPFYGTQLPGWVMIGVGSIILPVGLVLLGLGTLRTGLFTGWRRSVPLVFGLVLAAIKLTNVFGSHYWFLHPYDAVGIAVGWMALGYALWSEKSLAH